MCCRLQVAPSGESYEGKRRPGMAESNGSLMPGLWRDSLHVTGGLIACTPGSAPGSSSVRVWENFTSFTVRNSRNNQYLARAEVLSDGASRVPVPAVVHTQHSSDSTRTHRLSSAVDRNGSASTGTRIGRDTPHREYMAVWSCRRRAPLCH